MSRNAEITLSWADGDYRFRLGAGELEILQEETGYGPYVLADRLRARQRAVRLHDDALVGVDGSSVLVSLDGEVDPPPALPPLCTLKDIATTIRLGLIGGGMPHGDALKKVRAYVENKPIEHNRLFAFMIMQAAIYGAPEERLGEPPAPDPEKADDESQTFQTVG